MSPTTHVTHGEGFPFWGLVTFEDIWNKAECSLAKIRLWVQGGEAEREERKKWTDTGLGSSQCHKPKDVHGCIAARLRVTATWMALLTANILSPSRHRNVQGYIHHKTQHRHKIFNTRTMIKVYPCVSVPPLPSKHRHVVFWNLPSTQVHTYQKTEWQSPEGTERTGLLQSSCNKLLLWNIPLGSQFPRKQKTSMARTPFSSGS